MDEFEAMAEARARASLGDGELPAPLMAMAASMMAYLDAASLVLERAIDIAEKLDLPESTRGLKQAHRDVDIHLLAVTNWLIAMSKVGRERAMQRRMEDG